MQCPQLVERDRMEQEVVRLPKDLGELAEVRCHHRRLGRLLRHQHEPMDILDRLIRLLPQVELGGSVELREARLQVQLQALGRVEADVLRLRLVLADVVQMGA